MCPLGDGLARPGRSFYEASSQQVARRLLGKKLVRVLGGVRLAGIVVEAEAYRGRGDPASHAFRGRTKRNEVMFGEAGHAYIYFSYGVHYCLNVTTEPAGKAAAVLIRAVEPVEGVELMRMNRGVEDISALASGPGKLTKAFAIGRELNGEDLVHSETLFFEDGPGVKPVGVSPRIGVSAAADRRWRFFAKTSRFVSRRKQSPEGARNP